ncbi:MAG: MBL fold metallo-hydrolase [Paramuribaculum sp.]|nr:MBL fold metallo-hydrolase [Paramuribaculum sp.]
MSKKNKFQPSPLRQPGLFDIADPGTPGGGIFGEEIPVHPSILDFVVQHTAPTADKEPAPANPIEEPIKDYPVERGSLILVSFGSGSSGNCAYLGTRSGGILIDAGVDVPTVTKGLESIGLTLEDVKGILITHDHSDHIRFAYSIVRKHSWMGIYCTPKTLNGILRRHNISRRLSDYHRPIYKEFPFELAGFRITAFNVSHDGSDNSGFFLEAGSQSVAVATDLGSITERVDHYMRQANHIIIEANYDAEMLRCGRYPAYLKARIEADDGHLDNTVTARFLSSLLTPRLHNVFLCHLSEDNNTPQKAIEAIGDALRSHPDVAAGAITMPRLDIFPRYDRSTVYRLHI